MLDATTSSPFQLPLYVFVVPAAASPPPSFFFLSISPDVIWVKMWSLFSYHLSCPPPASLAQAIGPPVGALSSIRHNIGSTKTLLLEFKLWLPKYIFMHQIIELALLSFLPRGPLSHMRACARVSMCGKDGIERKQAKKILSVIQIDGLWV
jgi:hypothetical protein